jgi:hypothetical protein
MNGVRCLGANSRFERSMRRAGCWLAKMIQNNGDLQSPFWQNEAKTFSTFNEAIEDASRNLQIGIQF